MTPKKKFSFHQYAYTYITECNKRETKRLHFLSGILIIKNHPVCGQIDPALLFAPKRALLRPRKLNIHMLRIQQYTANKNS